MELILSGPQSRGLAGVTRRQLTAEGAVTCVSNCVERNGHITVAFPSLQHLQKFILGIMGVTFFPLLPELKSIHSKTMGVKSVSPLMPLGMTHNSIIVTVQKLIFKLMMCIIHVERR